MKNEPPKQLKTVPLTAAGLAAARANAEALSQANSRLPDGSVGSTSEPSFRAVVSGPDPAAAARTATAKRGGHGTTVTAAALGVLVVACVGAAWLQRTGRTVLGARPASIQAPAPAAAEAQSTETAVGFVVPARAPAPPVATATEAHAPAPPATGTVLPSAATPDAVGKRAARPRSADAVTTTDPASVAPRASAASEGLDEKKAAAPVAAPSTVDAILQQQLKSAIP